MEKIFSDYGIEICKGDGKYFLRYDSGEIVARLEDIEISEEDALRAQLSEKDAYWVIIDNQ